MGKVVIPGFRKIETSGGGEGGTTNYNDLTNKPSINNVPLVGNLCTVDLKLTDATLTEEGVPAEAKTVGQKLEEQSTSLTALSEQLGNHTVKSDVPENAVFTDTVYDDTEVQKRISDNGYGEVAGGKNLVNPKNIQKGKVVQFTDGSIVNNKNYFISGFISVSPGKTYTKSGFTNSSEHFYYDSAKNPIKAITTKTFTAPYNAAYVILSGSMSGGFNCQLEEGSVATDYEPYFPSNKMLEEEKADKSETTVNLFKPPLGTATLNGVKFVTNADSSVSISGAVTGGNAYTASVLVPVNIGQTYKVIGKFIGVYKKDNATKILQSGVEGDTTPSTFTATEDFVNVCMYVSHIDTIPQTGVISYPMLTTNLNATYDDFVPYTGDTGSLNGDLSQVAYSIGNPSELLTNEKILVNAINELNNRLTALENK